MKIIIKRKLDEKVIREVYGELCFPRIGERVVTEQSGTSRSSSLVKEVEYNFDFSEVILYV
jgi:hypothetical protein